MWTTYWWHPKSLEGVHQCCLWSILIISWNDYWTNISVLRDDLYLFHHRQKNNFNELVTLSECSTVAYLNWSSIPNYDKGKEREEVKRNTSKTPWSQTLSHAASTGPTGKSVPNWRTSISQGISYLEKPRMERLEEKERQRKQHVVNPDRWRCPTTTLWADCEKAAHPYVDFSHRRIHDQQEMVTLVSEKQP